MKLLIESLRPDVKGMPVLRLVANKAIDVLNKQRLLSLTSVQYQQHVQTTDSAPKRKQYGSLVPVPSSFIPSEGVHLRSISLTSELANPRRADKNFDSLGSWNNRMDLDISMEQSIKQGTLIPEITTDKVAVVSLVGRRDKNEDRYMVKRLRPDLLMFAMFDGHAGALAADFTCNNMADHINFYLERGETNLKVVLHKSFVALNNSFTKLLYNNYVGQDSVMGSGTTALVCLLRDSTDLFIGHVGDSKALMCRSGKVVRLTQDHKPTDPKEEERIKKAGGVITQPSLGRPRVNSKLDMSRSIGDVELKAYGVTCEPDTRHIQVKHGKDAFLVLSTDGINYVINDQEVIDIVCRCKDPQEGVQRLTDQAMHFGTEDNATAMIVPFGSWGKYANTANTVPFSFGRNIISRRC